MILADENLNIRFIHALRAHGFEVNAISEEHIGIADSEVAQIAMGNSSILITEDKDFGELIFAYNSIRLTVVFLRYRKEEIELMNRLLLQAIKQYANSPEKLFITISRSKIRVSKI